MLAFREKLYSFLEARVLWQRSVCASLGGVLTIFAMPPWGLLPLALLGIGVFYIVLAFETKPKNALLLGWLFGFGYFVIGLSWIGNALLVDGNQYAIFYPLAIAGLPVCLALFTAIPSYLLTRFFDLKKLEGYLAFIALLTGFEWLRGHVLTGFPWNLFGYLWAGHIEVAQLVSIGGTYWLSLCTLFWLSAPAFAILWKRNFVLTTLFCALTVASFTAAFVYGHNRLEQNPKSLRDDLVVKIIQPNIRQEDKWNPEKTRENLSKLLRLSEPSTVNKRFNTIIVWPETAITDYVLNDTGSRSAIRSMLSTYDESVILMSGVMRFENDDSGEKRYYNSLVSFDPALNPVTVYNKSHLVPFGEYVPYQNLIPIGPLAHFKGFEPGYGPQNLAIVNGAGKSFSFSPLVCYEIIFPGAVIGKNGRPDFIVNATNDAWYGDSAGPRQHFVMSLFRAIEEGIPVIRAANTGISGLADPLGRIIYKQDMFTESGQTVPLPNTLDRSGIYYRLRDRLFVTNLLILLAAIAICKYHLKRRA